MLSPHILVGDLLDCSPLVASLLLELRVGCIGCSMNKFCTLEELCALYGFDLENLLCKVRERLDHP